jgi:hypothetical protein
MEEVLYPIELASLLRSFLSGTITSPVELH